MNIATTRWALCEAILHYRRMRTWVRDYCDPEDYPNKNDMWPAIGEAWDSDDCPLCEEYRPWCIKCPLGSCSKGSIYEEIFNATSWQRWKHEAYRLICRMTELLKEHNDE